MEYNLDEYLNLTVLEKSISDFYSRNKVDFAKADIFRSFTLFLNDTIQSTYVGDEFMDNNDKINHFKWVWYKISEEFIELGFDFKHNSELFKYMKALFYDLFYQVDNKTEQFNKDFFNNIKVIIDGIFNYTILKNMESLYIFIDIYNIFDGRK